MQKRKMIIAAVSLLLCLLVLISVSYAWFTISLSPEILGIATNIGANGSLEVALLSNPTFEDPELIRSGIGDSAVVQEETVSNLAWGNVIDLADESYGLDQVSLLPAKLNAAAGENGIGSVSSSFLGFVEYSPDGRVQRQNMESVSAVFSEEGFIFNSEAQSYGVRGIGKISDVSSQQAALTMARSLVSSYKNTAVAETKAALTANGAGIIDICRRLYAQSETTFSADDVKVFQNTAVRMKKALDYVDSALRQGIIGYASSMIDDEETFKTLRSTVENTSIPLSMMVSSLPSGLPSGFSTWVTETDEKRYELQKAISMCNYLTAGAKANEMQILIDAVMDTGKVYLGEYHINQKEAFDNMSLDTTMNFAPGSGPFVTVADFCGNYSQLFTYEESAAVEAFSNSRVSEPHLDWMLAKLDDCEAAGSEEGPVVKEIEDIYGYAVDVAFRCNEGSGLLLQTEATERYGEATETKENMGSGSYMSFTSEQLTEEQMLHLVDAIRIGFVDSQNNLAAVAKLGTTEYTFVDEVFRAPLYLYEYEVSGSGSLIMGERRKEDAVIAELVNDTPVILTMVVWLDGDNIFNSHAAISNSSMTATLNLQFASSAELNPADIRAEMTEGN